MKRMLSSHACGFTLIEALATIAILAIVIPVLMQGFDLASFIAANTRYRAEATALAQSRLEEIMATQDWVSGGVNGYEQIGAMQYEWETALEQWENEVGVQQLSVVVTWQRRGQSFEITLSTLVYLPDSTITSNTSSGLTLGILP